MRDAHPRSRALARGSAIPTARRILGRAGSVLTASFVLAAMVPACSQGDGTGQVVGTLNVPDCWTGSFDLRPDFFAAAPYGDGLQIRLQKGSDFESFSDGVSLLVYDTTKVAPNPDGGAGGTYGTPLVVDLPPEVTPPGTPVIAEADPANVSLTLYLQKTCQTQNVTLHAVREVSPVGLDDCAAVPLQGADPGAGCDATKAGAGGVGTGKSFASFTHIFDAASSDSSASARLISGCFDVYLADPREVSPPAEDGGPIAPPRCRGHLRGSFRFFFERGRPAQPFP